MTPFNRKPAYFRFLRIILICAGGVLLGLSCEKQSTPVQPLNPQLSLTAEAGVTEAWLTVTTGEAEGMELLLTRDGAERLRFAACRIIPQRNPGKGFKRVFKDNVIIP